MTETKKKKQKKKALISEEDVSLLLRRYTATTILALLQEVAQFPDAKIDWKALVKKTSTGISNAREYQMLWRHLAYRDMFLEKVEDGAEPLDDDSDLESELEAFPPVSGEASVEAAACVKVLLASGSPSDSNTPSCATVEAPLTINIPNGQAYRALPGNPQLACTQGMNITVPVSVQKQPLPTATSTEGLDGNGLAGGSMPARRKRKPWTDEEDKELITAVQKYGERNWANILKGDFKGDRTASQLSQRWAIIRKRHANLNPGGTGNTADPQLSEAFLAAKHAFNHALNMPMVDNLTAACSAGTTHSSIPTTSTAVPSAPAEADTNAPSEVDKKPAVSSNVSQPLNQAQPAPHQAAATAFQKGTSSTTPKSRLAMKKPSVPTKSSVCPNPLVQAAAVAAGARIATPSTAASLLKAAQSKNAVHIRPGGSSLIKTSVPGGSMQLASNHSGPRPNVHYIRTGGASTTALLSSSGATPNILQPGSSQHACNNSIRPTSMTSAPLLSSATLNSTSEQKISVPSSSLFSCGAAEVKNAEAICIEDEGSLPKEEAKSAEETKDGSGNAPTKLNHDEGPSVDQTTVVENMRDSPNKEAVIDEMTESQNVCEKMVSSPVKDGGESSPISITS